MGKQAQDVHDVREMADHVARLIAERFGGAGRGEHPDLARMLRRRGGALPRRLRREARALAMADRDSAHPRIARQLDLPALSRAYRALCAHLEPLGQLQRWRDRSVGVAATLALGLVVLGVVAVWIALRRGLI